jgi:hypothetical protein
LFSAHSFRLRRPTDLAVYNSTPHLGIDLNYRQSTHRSWGEFFLRMLYSVPLFTNLAVRIQPEFEPVELRGKGGQPVDHLDDSPLNHDLENQEKNCKGSQHTNAVGASTSTKFIGQQPGKLLPGVSLPSFLANSGKSRTSPALLASNKIAPSQNHKKVHVRRQDDSDDEEDQRCGTAGVKKESDFVGHSVDKIEILPFHYHDGSSHSMKNNDHSMSHERDGVSFKMDEDKSNIILQSVESFNHEEEEGNPSNRPNMITQKLFALNNNNNNIGISNTRKRELSNASDEEMSNELFRNYMGKLLNNGSRKASDDKSSMLQQDNLTTFALDPKKFDIESLGNIVDL